MHIERLMNSRLIIYLVFLLSTISGKGQPSATSDSSNQPKRIIFIPNHFYNSFSRNVRPALSIHSGDTVETETIDALGRDKNGIKRQSGGNPLTGPFYILNSKAGDLLKISLKKITLNRNYAYTT